MTERVDNAKEHWNRFTKTGSIGDYLLFSGARSAAVNDSGTLKNR